MEDEELKEKRTGGEEDQKNIKNLTSIRKKKKKARRELMQIAKDTREG